MTTDSSAAFTVDHFAASRRMPSLPAVAMKLIDLAQQDDPDFAEVCRVIRSAPVIASKVMRTVNSALFAFRPTVETIEDAVTKLGFNVIRTLLLSFHIRETQTPDCETDLYRNHWRSSLTQGVIAELIAEAIDEDPSAAFLLGVIQDIGLLAMLSEEPEYYLDKIGFDNGVIGNVLSEQEHFGFSHVDVSSEIVERWGVSEGLLTAIRQHHDEAPVGLEATVLSNIGNAAAVGAPLFLQHRSDEQDQRVFREWLWLLDRRLKIDPQNAIEIVDEVESRVNEYAAIFNFDIGENASPAKVIRQANEMLQEIAIESQLDLVSTRRAANRKKRDDEIYRDPLSELFNRRYMDDHLDEMIARSIRRRKPIAVLFLDVDKFKEINDTFGHAVGDDAICHVATWLQSSTRKDDVVIRLGGDEFVILLQGVKEANVRSLADRIATNVPDMRIDGVTHEIGLSVGGVFYKPKRGDVTAASQLIRAADESMYDAKRGGGSQSNLVRLTA